MRRYWVLVLGLGFLLACASPEPAGVPVCAPLESLQPLPDRESCGDRELEEFRAALSARIGADARRALVRVEFDDAARVRAVCVARGPGYAPTSARRALAEHLDALLALPPGPACAAGKRLDLNRYEAKIAEVDQATARCQEQVRTSIETHRDSYFDPLRRVHEREFEDCMRDKADKADWIALDAPGSTRPWIYVKPEIPDPPGPPARETASRCMRKSRVFEKRAACIESDGWERLEPPPR